VGLLTFVWRAYRSLAGWVRVPKSAPPSGGNAARVTVIVPARDEERSIERCVRSLLVQDYPVKRYRVVVMDDRSSDATPQILTRLAAAFPHLMVLHGTLLPAGWQGKCWAIHQAFEQGCLPESEYVVFADADTAHEPHMLSSAVAYATRQRLDMLSVIPAQELGTMAEKLILPSLWAVLLSSNGTFDDVNDPRKVDIAKAVGHFIMFRVSAYQTLGGHEAVRGEIVEDFALARLAKRAGFHILLADGRELVRTRMYRSVGEIWQGYSKNAFDEAQKSPGGALAVLIALLFMAVGPWLTVAAGWIRYQKQGRDFDLALMVQGVLQVGASLLLGSVAARSTRLPAYYGLSQPLSLLFLWAILANSTWRNVSGQGVTWKGRTYAGKT
jgi:chlorobactene glucosyltransferase